jgi:hypothetical protein
LLFAFDSTLAASAWYFRHHWLTTSNRDKHEKGETRELVKFLNPKLAREDVVFFFSRFNSKGEPLISPASRTLTISFDPGIFALEKGDTYTIRV